MQKIPLTSGQFEINGLPWYEQNDKKLWRLPCEIKDRVSKIVWELSLSPSAGRIRFKSDTSLLGINAFYNLSDHMMNMCRIGQAGLDVYVDGEFWNCVFPVASGEMEGFFFDNTERKLRNYVIYLPPYHPVDVRQIILDDEAVVLPPDPYSLAKPVVFYGTSITQGGCSSRAGLTYQAMLCRELNVDFVNLGFSGNGKGDIPVAQAMAEIDAACYVLDYGQNNASLEEFKKVYNPFIGEIRKTRPDTPILLTSPITYTREKWDKEFQELQKERRNIVKEAYESRVQSGDRNIYLLEWNKIISLEDGEGQVDGVHPNDIGFSRMSKGLKPILGSILNIPGC